SDGWAAFCFYSPNGARVRLANCRVVVRTGTYSQVFGNTHVDLRNSLVLASAKVGINGPTVRETGTSVLDNSILAGGNFGFAITSRFGAVETFTLRCTRTTLVNSGLQLCLELTGRPVTAAKQPRFTLDFRE